MDNGGAKTLRILRAWRCHELIVRMIPYPKTLGAYSRGQRYYDYLPHLLI